MKPIRRGYQGLLATGASAGPYWEDLSQLSYALVASMMGSAIGLYGPLIDPYLGPSMQWSGLVARPRDLMLSGGCVHNHHHENHDAKKGRCLPRALHVHILCTYVYKFIHRYIHIYIDIHVDTDVLVIMCVYIHVCICPHTHTGRHCMKEGPKTLSSKQHDTFHAFGSEDHDIRALWR